MTSVFSWQNSASLFPFFILYSKAKLACYSRYLMTSYVCIPIPYDEKVILFWCQFQKMLQVFTELVNYCFSISGWGIDLDYYDIEWSALETVIILSQLRLNSNTAYLFELSFLFTSHKYPEMEQPLIVNKRVQDAALGCNLKNDRMISARFQGKTIQYHSNPSLCPNH